MHWPRGERREQTGRNFFLPVTSFLLVHLFSKHIKVYTGLFHINTCLWKFLSNKQEILFKQPPPGFTASPERMRGNRGAVNRPSSLGRSRIWMSGLRPSGPRDELRGLSPPSGVPPAPKQPQAPTPPSSVRRRPSLSLHPAPWLGGCPTTPPGVPWPLALAQLKLDPLLATPRHLFSQLSLAGIRLPRLPVWPPPPAASAHTCLKQSRSQPASPCRIPSPTTLTPEPR